MPEGECIALLYRSTVRFRLLYRSTVHFMLLSITNDLLPHKCTCPLPHLCK